MSITASQTTTALPSSSVDLTSLFASLQQAVASLSAVVAQLQAQAGTGAQAQPATGAATLGGGGTDTSQTGGCGCGAGMGAVSGADQLDQASQQDSEFQGADAGVRASTAHVKHGAHAKHGGGHGGHTGGAQPKPSGAQRTDTAGGSGIGDKLVAFALQQKGKPYVYGATGPSSFDCSGLIQYVAKHFGINLPRTAAQQARAGHAVSKSELQPGDLVYFQDKGASDVTHIGMYIGNGQYVHAPKPGDSVKVGSMSDSYSTSTFKGARRIT